MRAWLAAARRWACWATSLGRHHPEVMHPCCGACGAVVRVAAERPVALWSPPEGTPVVTDPFTPPAVGGREEA